MSHVPVINLPRGCQSTHYSTDTKYLCHRWQTFRDCMIRKMNWVFILQYRKMGLRSELYHSYTFWWFLASQLYILIVPGFAPVYIRTYWLKVHEEFSAQSLPEHQGNGVSDPVTVYDKEDRSHGFNQECHYICRNISKSGEEGIWLLEWTHCIAFCGLKPNKWWDPKKEESNPWTGKKSSVSKQAQVLGNQIKMHCLS